MEKIGLPALISRLFQDALDVGRAEIRLAKSRIFARLRAARVGLAMLFGALLFAVSGLIGLIVGLVLALVPFVGAALAGVIVLVAALAIAGALAYFGVKMLSGPKAEAES